MITIASFLLSIGCGTSSSAETAGHSTPLYIEMTPENVWMPVSGVSDGTEIWVGAEPCSSLHLWYSEPYRTDSRGHAVNHHGNLLLRYPGIVLWQEDHHQMDYLNITWFEGVFRDGGYLIGEFIENKDVVISKCDSEGNQYILWSEYRDTGWGEYAMGVQEKLQVDPLADGGVLVVTSEEQGHSNRVRRFIEDGTIRWETLVNESSYPAEYYGHPAPLEFNEGVIGYTTQTGLVLLDSNGVELGVIDSILPYGYNTSKQLSDGSYLILNHMYGQWGEDEPTLLSVIKISGTAQLEWETELETPMTIRTWVSSSREPSVEAVEVSPELCAILITNPVIPGSSPRFDASSQGIVSSQSPGVALAMIDDSGQLLSETTSFGGRYSSAGISMSEVMFLFGLNTDGSCLWTQQVSMDGVLGMCRMCRHSVGASLQECIDLTSGEVIGYGTAPISNSTHDSGVYVCKVSSDARVMWERVFDLGSSETVTAVVELDNGVIAVTGLVRQGFSADRNIYVLLLDSDGNPQFE